MLRGGNARSWRFLERAPLPWLVGQEPADLSRQAALVDPLPPRRRVRVEVVGDRVEVAARDRRGLLASMTGVLADVDLVITPPPPPPGPIAEW
ncbi:MAG: hypothetical protein M3P34_02295 [Actinomycetota bacterium]|nr:hypothetical protein [Actinomycetota bacterium]